MSKFQTFYRGQYTSREQPCLEEYLAQAKALEERGPIDVQALIAGTLPEGTSGVGPKLKVEPDMMTYQAYKYDPENPLYFDDDYAKKMGYAGRIAMPAVGAHDDSFLTAFPHAARDMMCVCSLNHSVRQLAPVYAGDTLYLVKDAIHLTDITPDEGGEYRNFVIRCEGSVYNQRGEKVLDVMFGATENLKSWKPGQADPGVRAWESPDWWKRPQHVYTQEDWETIKHETVQGGSKIIELRGRSSFQSPAYNAVKMIEAAMGGEEFTWPAGTYVNDGKFQNVMMAMPTVIDASGVHFTEPDGTPEEIAGLQASYEHLCKMRDEIVELGIVPPVKDWKTVNPNL